MKVRNSIKRFAIVMSIVILIISFFLFISPVRVNVLSLFGEESSLFCGRKGYQGNYFLNGLGGLDCCGTSECCGSNGDCIKNGCYICK